MKKISALLIICAFGIGIASADPLLFLHGSAGWLGAGSTINTDNFSKTEKSFGDNMAFGGGLGVNIPFGGYFGLQPGADFYYNTFGFTYGNDSKKLVENYMSVDIPLLFTIKYSKWNFALGPYLSIPFNIKYDNDGDTTSITCKTPVNFGLEAGIGYEERFGMGALVFSAKYKLDFLPTKGEIASSTEELFTRRGLFVDLGYKIPLTFLGK